MKPNIFRGTLDCLFIKLNRFFKSPSESECEAKVSIERCRAKGIEANCFLLKRNGFLRLPMVVRTLAIAPKAP